MVIIEKCKSCGSSSTEIKRDGKYDFLVCSHCGGTLALLSEDREMEVPRNLITISGIFDNSIITSSGISYSGFPLQEYSRS